MPSLHSFPIRLSLPADLLTTISTLWRGGFALAAGGPIWGALVTLFFASDFANRAIPVLDQYCSKRYGTMWQDYKREVKWKLLPGIY